MQQFAFLAESQLSCFAAQQSDLVEAQEAKQETAAMSSSLEIAFIISGNVEGDGSDAMTRCLLAGANAHVHHRRLLRSGLGGLAGSDGEDSGDGQECVFHGVSERVLG